MVMHKEYYQRIKVHSTKEGEDENRENFDGGSKYLEAYGEYNIEELRLFLGANKWVESYPLGNRNEVVVGLNKEGIHEKKETSPIKISIYKSLPKTYKNLLGTSVIESDVNKNYHQMYIFVNKDTGNEEDNTSNLKIDYDYRMKVIQDIKELFEKGTKIAWKDHKLINSKLEKKIESN